MWEDGRRSMSYLPSDRSPCETVSIASDLRELREKWDILPGPKGRSEMNEGKWPEVRGTEIEVGSDDVR